MIKLVDSPSSPFIDRQRAHEELDRMLDQNPVALAIIIETSNLYDWTAIPRSQSLARGLMEDCLKLVKNLEDEG